MKKYLRLALCVAIVCGLAGCRGGSSTGSPPANSSAPAQVSSSDQVVKVFSHYIPSAPIPGSIELVISPGYHVNANPATFSYLIATEVQPGKIDGVTVSDKIVYPPGALKKFEFAEQPLSVYEGNVSISIPIKITSPSKTQRLLPLKVRVQACDSEKCFPPATLDASLPIGPDSPGDKTARP